MASEIIATGRDLELHLVEYASNLWLVIIISVTLSPINIWFIRSILKTLPHMRSKRKGRWCLPKLNPLVPSKFIDVQDVSFLSKSGKIWRVFSQLKNIFGSHVGYGGSLFRTIFPEDHIRVFIAHVFAYRLLKHINTQSCPIWPLFPTLQNS